MLLFVFELFHLVRKRSGLTLVVVHVPIKVMFLILTSSLQLDLLTLDHLLVKLQLSLFFPHLMSKLFEHGNLAPRFFIENCGLCTVWTEAMVASVHTASQTGHRTIQLLGARM